MPHDAAFFWPIRLRRNLDWQMPMKILIISNQSRSMAIFWRVLIMRLAKESFDIVCCVPGGDNEAENELRQLGCGVIHYPLDRKGVNPVHDIATYFALKKIFSEVRPDVIFATTIKPVIYGCLAGSGVPYIFPAITGLGYAFEADSPLKKVLHIFTKFLYGQALKSASAVFFQNRDDAGLFSGEGLVGPEKPVFYARGTGVDVERFSPAPFPPFPPDGEIIFLLIARLLEAKGIEDYANAARILKKNGARARFQLLGIPEKGPGAISPDQISQWENEKLIEYLGESRDVRPCIAGSHVAVLPSWREGTPTSIMEAMAMGRPGVVTDVPGCREVVMNGENGWLVRVHDPASLASGMENFLRDPDSIRAMGANSRKMAVEMFDANVVADGIIRDMFSVIGKKPGIA